MTYPTIAQRLGGGHQPIGDKSSPTSPPSNTPNMGSAGKKT